MAVGDLITQMEAELSIGARVDAASDAANSSLVALLRMLMKASRSSKGYIVRKTVTLDGASGSGAQGTIALFTVTGTVRAFVTAYCTTLVAGATGTIEVGISGATAVILAQTTGTDIDADEIWHDATPDAAIEADSVSAGFIITAGSDIIATVATADLTAGVIVFVVEWEPLSSDGAVVAA